ncbi:MAG: hypothetical protein WCB53_03740, partial [Terriglobales bacterium]
AVWGLALAGSFAWNVTLSVVARLFYYGVVCAAVIALRRKKAGRPAIAPSSFRLPLGPLWSVIGVAVCVLLATQTDFSKSLILGFIVAAAVLNWLSARSAGTSA